MVNKKLWVTCALIFIVCAASAFKISFDHSQFWNSIHENITENALGVIRIYDLNGNIYKISDNALVAIREENTENDEEGLEFGQLHFDDALLSKGSKFIFDGVEKAINSYKKYALNQCYLLGGPLDQSYGECGYGVKVDGKSVYVDLGAASHTVQDFFAHSNWAEINAHLGAYDCLDVAGKECYLDPRKRNFPIPQFGVESNPFSNPEISQVTNGVKILQIDDEPVSASVNAGVCNYSFVLPESMRLSTAYYDYGMSDMPGAKINPVDGIRPVDWFVSPYNKCDYGDYDCLYSKGSFDSQDSYDFGLNTDGWSGKKKTYLTGAVRFFSNETIQWPAGRCVHGGDTTAGLNKDTESRDNHFKARQGAVLATRSLMNHFLNGANVVANGSLSGLLEKVGTTGSQSSPRISKIERYFHASIPTTDPMAGRVFKFTAPAQLNYAGALEVNFQEDGGTGGKCKILNDYKELEEKIFFCDFKKDLAKVTVLQAANQSFSLYEKADFFVSCKQNSLHCGKLIFGNQNPTISEKFSIQLEIIVEVLTDIKDVVWDFGVLVVESVRGMTDYLASATGVGTKTVTATYKTSDGVVLGVSTGSVSVAQAVVSTTTTITAVQTAGGVAIASGSSTTETKPVMAGTLSAPLGSYEVLRLYRGTALMGAATTSARTWAFTPATALPVGTHSLKAVVARADGVEGTPSAAWVVTVVAAPSPGVLHPTNGYRYEVITCGTWTDCRANASARGGSLVTIDSDALNTWLLKSFASQTANANGFWIGLYQSATGLAWVSGRPVSYTNWEIGEPNNGILGSHMYTASYSTVRAGKWNDIGASIGGSATSMAIVEYAPVATGRLNDTGITASQCYQAGSNTLVSCTSAGALALNNQQDGMVGRDVTAIGTSDGKLGFSYSAVGDYAITECVKDNITGLIWEGKTATGTRAGSNTYTNYHSSYYGTQAQMDAVTNTYGYVAAVNAAGLCGASDWRLPTPDELQSLVDYGVAYPGPTIDATWLPNTRGTTLSEGYWSSAPYIGEANGAWGVNFGYGFVGSNFRYNRLAVRLVRAGQ